MNVQTFRARTIQEALAQVRRSLGPEAAVLHTREVNASGPLGWFPALRRIEVTAALGVNVPSRLPAPEALDAPQPSSVAPPSVGKRAVAPSRHSMHDEVKGQLNELQALVENLCRRTRPNQAAELPDVLFRLYTDLLDVEVGEELARELVERARTTIARPGLDDLLLIKAHLAGMLEEEISITGPLAIHPGCCRRVSLVGPTGVGKTTTIAKLAANYRLREKRKIGLITVDTYRIAAVEQLRTYADIMDLPMQVVSTPREMRQAVRAMAHLELVLIDTAGRSPKDEVKIQELKSFLAEAETDEVHLVLSVAAGASTLRRTAECFADVGTSALIFTKLDEANSFGHLLPLLRDCRLPISYLTDGQNVPDDIAAAERSRIAQLILGTDEHVTGAQR
ncbi:MAG TPA: flagellar biosynthesis protein FlhF [Pirellulales bacterium]|jgi:flagellar biosynthesis protein FlhF|nr:flagellar biosynthesis protein FlhF [Pirellulales bacterium]